MSDPLYERRLVAFLDILGFSTMIGDSVNSISMREKILEAMKIIHRVKEANGNTRDIEVSTFSDSIVISYPITMEGSLLYLLLDIIHLQLDLGNLGILIRGGITIGDVYHKDDIVYGPAMNEAYRLEEKEAIYPRVVIKLSTLVDGIQLTADPTPYGHPYDEKEIMGCVKPDNYSEEQSDLYFVDFLRQDSELTNWGNEYLMWLTGFRKTLLDGLNRYSSSSSLYKALPKDEQNKADRIFKKYRWIHKYWNDVVTDEEALYPVPDGSKEDQIAFRKAYKKLKIAYRYPYH